MMATTPTQNQLLAALPAADLQHLLPQLALMKFPLSAELHEAGKRLDHVYFPVTAIVSLTSTMQDGASAEFAVVGNEEVVGVCAFMGDGCSLGNAVVQTAGWGWRMQARALDQAARDGAPLMRLLLRYTQQLFTQMAQISACSRHHALEEKLCRWLLLHLDRISGNELVVTHERIANMLGVRREGVTAGALKLQKAGLVRCQRGRITILDRAALEDRSCECYALVHNAAATSVKAERVPARTEQAGLRRIAPQVALSAV